MVSNDWYYMIDKIWKTGDQCKHEGCEKILRKPRDPKTEGTTYGEGWGMCSIHWRAYKKANDVKVHWDIDWNVPNYCEGCGGLLCKRGVSKAQRDIDGTVRLGGKTDTGYTCYVCEYNRKREAEGRPKINRAEVSEDGSKQRCNKCLEWKPLTVEHYRTSPWGNGWRSDCKVCVREFQRTKRSGNPEHNLKAKNNRYNIDYLKMLDDQGGCCAICGMTAEDNPRGTFDVDHWHGCCDGHFSCGECVRGLLCRNCNLILGLYGDDIEEIKKNFGGSLWGNRSVSYLNN